MNATFKKKLKMENGQLPKLVIFTAEVEPFIIVNLEEERTNIICSIAVRVFSKNIKGSKEPAHLAGGRGLGVPSAGHGSGLL
ncbi:MAG: hypothetical protein C4589_12480 [Peptococcaceae bacterium]|nr:MAG: hypothetical protein C4589_12480 [Peptococcaceae bacterium]